MLRTAATTEQMRTPATASAVLHASALAVAFFGLPNLFNRPPPVEPEPVMVEFEAIDKKAGAPTVGNPPPQPRDAKIAEETTKAPPPRTAEPPPAPVPPKQLEQALAPPPPTPEPKIAKPDPPKPQEDVVALKPREPEPPKVEKPPEPKPEPPVVKKPDPPKPVPPKPAPKTPDKVDSVLDDILKNKTSPNTVHTPEQQPRPPQQVTRQAPAAPNLTAVVTASEVEGVRQKIRPCWNFPHGIRDQQTLIVTLVVSMKQDGTPDKVELKETGRYNNDPIYRAAADSARRAIMNPRCQPWPLAAEKFANWRTITFNFDPRDY